MSSRDAPPGEASRALEQLLAQDPAQRAAFASAAARFQRAPDGPARKPPIPDYELVRQIGKGAFGDVWLARSLTGVYRAVKVIWRDRFKEAAPYEREFNGVREFAQISINDPRQLALLHVGRNDADGFFYYVMELADDVHAGRKITPETYEPLTLKYYLSHERRLPIPELVAHAVELCRALINLHAKNLLHSDIKPSNIVLIEGRPKLADVGLMTLAKQSDGEAGTEGFVPPEGSGTIPADIYSLGKVLYELATGRDRNDCPRLPEDLDQRPDRRELLELNEVIVRACEPAANDRYNDVEPLLRDLLLLQAGRSVRALRLTERGLARARRGLAFVGVFALIAVGGALLERQRAHVETAGRRQAEAERDELARVTLYSAGLSRAQRALDTGDFGRARDLLLELAPSGQDAEDLRGFEWRALWHQARGDEAEVVRPRGAGVDRIFYSPSGSHIAVHDTGRAVTVYDAKTLQPVQQVPQVHRLAGFSANGQWLLGTDPASLIQAWQVATGDLLRPAQSSGFNYPLATLPGPGLRLLSLRALPNHPLQLQIWNLDTGVEERVWGFENAPKALWEFRLAHFSAEETRYSVVVRHDKGRAATFQQLVLDVAHPPIALKWPGPAGAALITATEHARQLLPFLLSPREPLGARTPESPLSRQLPGMSSIGAFELSPDRALVVAGDRRGHVTLLDARTGEEYQTLRGHSGGITAAAWAPNGESLLTGDSTGSVRRWQLPMSSTRDWTEIAPLPDAIPMRVHFSADSQRFATSLGSSRVGIYLTENLSVEGVLAQAGAVLGFMPDQTVITIGPDGHIQRWSPSAALQETQVLPWTQGGATAAALDPETGTIVAVSRSGEMNIHSLISGVQAQTQIPHSQPHFVAVSGKAGLAAVISDGLQIHLVPLSPGHRLTTLRLAVPVQDIVFSPSGRYLVASLVNGDAAIIQAATGQVERTLQISNGAVSAAFTPDETRLLAMVRSGLLHIYRTEDWREIAALADPDLPEDGGLDVLGIGLSADGHTLAVHRRDGKLRLWRAPPVTAPYR